MLDDRTRFGSYLTQLLSKGQVYFSAAQAHQALGISKSALLKAAEKQQKRGNLISPRRSEKGFLKHGTMGLYISPDGRKWLDKNQLLD